MKKKRDIHRFQWAGVGVVFGTAIYTKTESWTVA